MSELPANVTFFEVTCSACSKVFEHVEIGKGLMKCPKCGAEYVLKNGEWHDKRFQEFLAAERAKAQKAQ
jgi:PHP family Zn ribbon phosphoesterase